jgi:hypothetical protein
MLDRAVYCSASMQHFGRLASKVMGVPLFVNTFCGDVGIIHIIGMYDPYDYTKTLEDTARCRKKIIHWCGSDVQFLRDSSRLPLADHVCDSDNLKQELLGKGVVATTISWPTSMHVEPSPFPEKNTIAFYGGSNPDKYGMSTLAAVQECIPEWEIFAYGAGVFDEEQMRRVISDCKLYIRLTDHDGGMASPKEFMEAGRYAITTHPIPFARVVVKEDIPGLIREIAKVEELSEPDLAASAYYKEFNSEERFLTQMREGGFYE